MSQGLLNRRHPPIFSRFHILSGTFVNMTVKLLHSIPSERGAQLLTGKEGREYLKGCGAFSRSGSHNRASYLQILELAILSCHTDYVNVEPDGGQWPTIL